MTNLLNSFNDNNGRAERLRMALLNQLRELLDAHQIALGVPAESRVKTWPSIEEKNRRKGGNLNSVFDLSDFVGIRLILLFRRDVPKTIDLLCSHLSVVSTEDTSLRLGESEFGYHSQHLVCRIPTAWLQVPSFAGLGDLNIEIQVRSLAQHIWAAASHKRQYKNAEGVPPPLRRTINRISALLETVDLEFDRVLVERTAYTDGLAVAESGQTLNVDLLGKVLSEVFPEENRGDDEPYAELLSDLSELNLLSPTALTLLLRKHKDIALTEDRKLVADYRDGKSPNAETQSRVDKGVYFAHVGLARKALRAEFGDEKIDGIFRARRFAAKNRS